MFRNALFLFALLSLLSVTDCNDECDFLFAEQGTLEINLEAPASRLYPLGDTIWLVADFPAELDPQPGGTTLSEAGGLYVTRVFRVPATDSSRLVAALTAFTPTATTGDLLPNGPNDDPAATVLRYTCPGGRCGFRQGFRLDSVGSYLLEVIGSTYLINDGSDPVCGEPAFAVTELNAPSNLAGVPLMYPLRYERTASFRSNIDTIFRRNLLYITVQ